MNTPKRRAAKFQKGNVILRSKIFYIRFYRNGKRVTEVLRLANREPLRCDKTFKTTTSKTVLQIAADHMKPINEATEHAQLNQHGVKVEDFFTSVYVPWTQANLRATTAMAYKKVWELYLAKHMTNRTLDEYRTHDASAVLTSLAKRGLGHAVIGHVRALGCGIFQHAVNLGNLDLNPWRGVKCLAKIKDRQGTHAYTKEEWRAIRNALSSRRDAVAVVDLGFCAGLRPSEICGLRWEHFSEDFSVVTIQQASVKGIVDAPKTKKSIRTERLIEPLKSSLAAWRAQCANVTVGWVFPTENGGPLNMESLVAHVIKPLCKLAGITFAGVYAARRGHGTIVTRVASLTAARHTLGHSTEVTTARFYALPDRIAGEVGLSALEAFLTADTTTGTEPVN